MKYNICIFCFIILMTSCKKKENAVSNNTPVLIDTSRVAVIKYEDDNPECKSIFEHATNANLNNIDLKKIELAIDKIIEKRHPLQMKRYEEIAKMYPEEKYIKEDFILKKEKYIRRYLVITNTNGEKEVYVAMVCDEIAKHYDFKKTLDQGHGGGSCLFSFKLNLTTNKYYEVYFNAEA